MSWLKGEMSVKYNTHKIIEMTVIINTYRSCLFCEKKISASESLCEECMSKYKIKQHNYGNEVVAVIDSCYSSSHLLTSLAILWWLGGNRELKIRYVAIYV